MAAKKSTKLAGLVGKFSSQGRTIEYGGAKILVAPLLSVGEARKLEASRRLAGDNESDWLDAMVTVFIERAKDPETKEPFATPGEREQVADTVPLELLLKVLQAASGVDPQAAAKN